MTEEADAPNKLKVRVFVDFWNFQLSLNKHYGKTFQLDWRRLGPYLARLAVEQVGEEMEVTFEGMAVYASYNRKTEAGRRLRSWLSVIDRFPGVEVVQKARKPKSSIHCPQCRGLIRNCPHCGKLMNGTVEKGIDTAIVTDMIRLAWDDAYDIAVLVSHDADFVPAAEFLARRSKKVVNACFGGAGAHLASKCWASFDVKTGLEEIIR